MTATADAAATMAPQGPPAIQRARYDRARYREEYQLQFSHDGAAWTPAFTYKDKLSATSHWDGFKKLPLQLRLVRQATKQQVIYTNY